MKQKILIALPFVIMIPLVVFFLLLRSKKQIPITPPLISPTPSEKFSILSTYPKNNAKNVSPSTQINITVSSLPTLSSFRVAIQPNTQFEISTFDNIITITPTNRLSQNAVYTVTISYSELSSPYSFSFTTSTLPTIPTGQIGPDRETVERLNQQLRETAPQAFLANNLPHSEPTFSMIFFHNKNTGSFRFTVVEKGSAAIKSKSDALYWMHSLKLTDQQIQKLTMTYILESVQKLIDAIPHDGNFFSISYDLEKDEIQAILHRSSQQQGDTEMDAYLKSFGISNRSEIPNLFVVYLP